jgi:uncharacterized protein YbaR (Trm112 family)
LDAVTSDIATLDKCVHVFHFKCIFEWSKVTNACPLCKKNFLMLTQNKDGKKTKYRIKPKKQVAEFEINESDYESDDSESDFIEEDDVQSC